MYLSTFEALLLNHSAFFQPLEAGNRLALPECLTPFTPYWPQKNNPACFDSECETNGR